MEFELLEPDQEKFFKKHLNTKYYLKKKKERKALIERKLEQHTINKGAVADVLRQIPFLPKNSGLDKKLLALHQRYHDIDANMTLKGLKSAVASLEKANADFTRLLADCKAFVVEAFSTVAVKDDVDPGEAIKRLKQAASIEQRDLVIQYGEASSKIMDDITKASGEAVTTPPVIAAFEKDIFAFLVQIRDVAESGQTVKEAEAKLNAITAAMRKSYSGHMANLNVFANSDHLAEIIANGALRGKVVAALSGVKDAALQLTNWGLPSGKEFAKKATDIESKAGPIFDMDSAQNAGKAKAIAEARVKLADAAEGLQTAADKAVADHRAAFAAPQLLLKKQLNAERARFSALDAKLFEKGQRKPAEDLLAMTETAIRGLNGCNIAALDPAGKLLFEFAKLVDELEKLKETNTAIKALLKEAGTVIKRHSGSKNILYTVFAEHQTALDTLNTEWPGMSPSEALKAATAFKAKIDAEAVRQDDLVARRAGIATRIKELKGELGNLTKKLNELQKANGMDKGDYRGQFATDLATCVEWNKTKLELPFYSTIDARLDRIAKGIGNVFKGLDETAGMTDDEILAQAVAAKKAFDDAVKKMGDKIDAKVLRQAKEALAAQLEVLNVRSDLVSEEKRIIKAEEDAAQDKKQYLEDSKKWLEDLAKEAKSGDYAEILTDYKDDVKVQTDRITNTRKLVKKGSDVRAAISELSFVQKTVDAIKKRGTATKKDNLPKIGDDWKTARKTFFDNCYTLLDEVEAFEKSSGATEGAKKKLDTALGAIIAQLNNAAFDPAARIFADEGATARDRLAAREMALAEVRKFNDMIKSDQVIRKCTRNPFDVKAFADPIARKLRQIELEVLRGVSRT